MDNSLSLKIGQEYEVTKSFVDYDGILHPEGETWIYKGTKFLAYDDGLTLYVSKENQMLGYRLQWRKDSQSFIIENFKEYVKLRIK